jgi:hypothetical protein
MVILETSSKDKVVLSCSLSNGGILIFELGST